MSTTSQIAAPDIKGPDRDLASDHADLPRPLKHDSLGAIVLERRAGVPVIVRDFSLARRGCRWLARHLARREAAALARLATCDGTPNLVAVDARRLVRSYLGGAPMHVGQPRSRAYFRAALGRLRQLHRAGIAHNDLAKEANWLCLPGDDCGIVDFQIAHCSRRRGRIFRLLAREDLRHLLKHKRHYLPEALTARERAILARPAWPARLWRAGFKPLYRLVTRGLLGWPERTDAREREHGSH